MQFCDNLVHSVHVSDSRNDQSRRNRTEIETTATEADARGDQVIDHF